MKNLRIFMMAVSRREGIESICGWNLFRNGRDFGRLCVQIG
jgi:hypothetical protein